MASQAARAASGAAQKIAKSGTRDQVLQKGARRDPELYVLLGIMSGAFGLAGYYFGRNPTTASSEAAVSMKQASMPWQVEDEGHESSDTSKHFKYQYHPRGDKSAAPKSAPSALNTVIVPNVTLPKDIHDMFNKWGKDGY